MLSITKFHPVTGCLQLSSCLQGAKKFAQEANENPQMLNFMPTDLAFIFLLRPKFITPLIDSLLYPMGPRQFIEVIHYYSFVMTHGFFRLFTIRSQLNLKTSMEGISLRIVNLNSFSFYCESYFLHLFKALCRVLRMLSLPWLNSERIVRYPELATSGGLAKIRRYKLSNYRDLLNRGEKQYQVITEFKIFLPVQHTNYAYAFKITS